MGVAIADLAKSLDWTRVYVIADSESPWSAESAEHFASAHLARGGEVIHAPSLLHHADCVAADVSTARDGARALLEWLDEHGAMVVMSALNPRCNREFFSSVATTGLLEGEEYAFMLNWPTISMLYNNDGSMNVDALTGAKGALGVLEASGSGAVFDAYLERWAQRSTRCSERTLQHLLRQKLPKLPLALLLRQQQLQHRQRHRQRYHP